MAGGLGLSAGWRTVRIPRICARLNRFRVGEDQPKVGVIQRLAGRGELRIARIHAAQEFDSFLLTADVPQAHALGVQGDVSRARHPVTFDCFLSAPKGLFEHPERRQRRGGHRRPRGL
ncbi:Uncharacterised protein [Mycobacterium tuberculosis]|uniref:Uncharacterized protein n=1 Tax=Mycobacterium tuberculosis TaxID=1773 RepID=A0A916P850_MYCTX|nr:Uncharacterised protein [Mycobacterium tuberculosis]COY29835.1 Uncharacterised protein [Mycobacterium tuberculosis]